MKKALSFLLAMAMTVAVMLVVVQPVKVEAVSLSPSNVKGSDFTESEALAEMLDIVFSGDIDIHDYTNEKFGVEVSMPLGMNMSTSSDYCVKDKTSGGKFSGKTCYIYAQAVYNKLFNEVVYHGGTRHHSIEVISNGPTTASFDMFNKAGVRCGAYMRTTAYANGSYNDLGHSMIILSYDEEYITYLGGNQNSNHVIDIRCETWQDFNKARLSGQGRYIDCVVQPTDKYYDTLYPSHKCTEFEGLGVCTECGKTFDWEKTFDKIAAGTYKVTSDFTPRTNAPYSDATKASTSLKQGDTVEVVGAYTNAYGSKFYKFTYNSGKSTGYVYESYLSFSKPNALSVQCTGFKPSSNASLSLGQSYEVLGTISANYPLKTVEAYFDGSKYATWTASNQKTTSFNVASTDINSKLKFANMSLGAHTITLKATDIHNQTSTFFTASFNIVKNSANNVLTIHYNANGGTIADPIVIGTNYKVSTTDGTWAYARSGPGTSYSQIDGFAPGSIVTVIETKKMSDYTWGKIKYGKEAWVALGSWMTQVGTAYDPPYYLSSSIVYDRNTSQAVSPALKYGEELKDGLYNNTTFKLSRDGYNFVGWSLTADGSGAVIDQDKVIKPEEIVPDLVNGNKTVTMYAIWEKIGCDHSYTYKSNSTGHWKECTLCGDKQSTSSHSYTNNCDTYCDTCGYTRTITHTYDNGCDPFCNTCGYVRITAHTYSNSCDTSCNVCGDTRTISHSYSSSYAFNSYSHWKACTVCGNKESAAPHSYSNDCDTTCNTCGYDERTITHIYTYDCDTDCNECGNIRETTEEHLWMPPSPTDENTHTCPCKYCEAVDLRQHVYTNDCDNSCNHCRYERAITHTYNNDCDSDCNVCGETRSTQHIYDNENDTTCNICGEVRTVETLPSSTPDETEPSTKPSTEPDTKPNTNNTPSNSDKNGNNGDDDNNNTTIIIVAVAGAVTVSAVSIFGTALIMKKKR